MYPLSFNNKKSHYLRHSAPECFWRKFQKWAFCRYRDSKSNRRSWQRKWWFRCTSGPSLLKMVNRCHHSSCQTQSGTHLMGRNRSLDLATTIQLSPRSRYRDRLLPLVALKSNMDLLILLEISVVHSLIRPNRLRWASFQKSRRDHRPK